MAGSHNYKMFKFFTRKFKTSELHPPANVKDSFTRFAGGGTHLTADQLRRFMVVHQCDTRVSISDAERIIDQVVHRRHHITKYARNSLNLDDFFHFLFSDDLNGPIKPQVHHDMSAPLSHYFIYTGHNSYLTGNQLSSDCSDVPIIRSLHMGVRVIELDLWPNSTKDDILVLHGRTLTTPVSLIKCLKSIKENAFDSSVFPVIITLEDHLTSYLQAKVAEMLIETFGELLYYPGTGFESLKELPSPESLKRRIVISTKPPKEYLEGKRDDPGGSSIDGGDSCENGVSDKETLDVASELRADEKCGSEPDDEDVNALLSQSIKSGALEYKLLITIHAGKPKHGIEESLKVVPDKVRRLSLSEQGLEKAAASYATNIVRFTQTNILRVYPKGTRVTSSNYNPLIGWMHGAQMVAFNMQGYGKSLWLMQGMFRANGGCGYVKKPDFLIGKGPSDEVFDPRSKLVVKQTLHVKVYMGDGWRLDFSPTHFDKYSPPDFYTKLSIVGVPADGAKKKTRTIEDDWCPVWDEEFTFQLTVPELALLGIEVKEYNLSEKNEFGGQTCLPVSELRPGIRAVPLYDKKGKRLKSVKLLMRFEFVDQI